MSTEFSNKSETETTSNFWIDIGGASIHIGKYRPGFKFLWNIRSILLAVLCHVKLSTIRKEDIKNTIKTMDVFEDGFEVDLYGTIQIRNDLYFRLISSGVPAQWLNEISWDLCLLDYPENKEIKIKVGNINSGLLLYWISCLFDKGSLICEPIMVFKELTPDTTITWNKFISIVTSRKGLNPSLPVKISDIEVSSWTYEVGNLCCSSLSKFG